MCIKLLNWILRIRCVCPSESILLLTGPFEGKYIKYSKTYLAFILSSSLILPTGCILNVCMYGFLPDLFLFSTPLLSFWQHNVLTGEIDTCFIEEMLTQIILKKFAFYIFMRMVLLPRLPNLYTSTFCMFGLNGWQFPDINITCMLSYSSIFYMSIISGNVHMLILNNNATFESNVWKRIYS